MTHEILNSLANKSPGNTTFSRLCDRRLLPRAVLATGLPSRKHLRTKVTPDFHLTYSKMGEIWGRNQNDKMDIFSILLHKIICCGCVLESPRRGDSNTHPKHMFYGEHDN